VWGWTVTGHSKLFANDILLARPACLSGGLYILPMYILSLFLVVDLVAAISAQELAYMYCTDLHQIFKVGYLA